MSHQPRRNRAGARRFRQGNPRRRRVGENISKRFEARGIASTEASRRAYREMLFTTPGLSRFISGAILYDETIRQADAHGVPLAEVLASAGIIPGIKVDTGAKPLAGCPARRSPRASTGCASASRSIGARRALREVARRDPRQRRAAERRRASMSTRTRSRRYAALCQEQGLVPIVEPEVLMDGTHSLGRAEEVTGHVLERVFHALREQRVSLEEHAAQAEHGRARQELSGARVDRSGRDGDGTRAPAARACGGARNRLPLRRPERARGDRASPRD